MYQNHRTIGKFFISIFLGFSSFNSIWGFLFYWFSSWFDVTNSFKRLIIIHLHIELIKSNVRFAGSITWDLGFFYFDFSTYVMIVDCYWNYEYIIYVLGFILISKPLIPMFDLSRSESCPETMKPWSRFRFWQVFGHVLAGEWLPGISGMVWHEKLEEKLGCGRDLGVAGFRSVCRILGLWPEFIPTRPCSSRPIPDFRPTDPILTRFCTRFQSNITQTHIFTSVLGFLIKIKRKILKNCLLINYLIMI